MRNKFKCIGVMYEQLEKCALIQNHDNSTADMSSPDGKITDEASSN